MLSLKWVFQEFLNRYFPEYVLVAANNEPKIIQVVP